MTIYCDAYTAVKERISVRATENTDIGEKDIVFRNNTSFRSSITSHVDAYSLRI